MIGKGIRGRMCQAINKYAKKANNKYMKNHDKNIESSYLIYLDANNLYGWAVSEKFPVNSFKWVEELSKFNGSFIKGYDESTDRRYFIEVDVEHPQKLFNLHRFLPFLPERKKIKKFNKLVCNIQDEGNYVVHMRASKQALNHGLILKKVHRVIPFNKKAWLKPYIHINTKLRKKSKK